jgi:molecular chaperone DnaK (HSP70)
VLARVFAAMQKLKVEIEGKGLKIDGIELFGGGTRIPAVVRLVQQLWKMETSRTINSN